jgi:hypothetical protein
MGEGSRLTILVNAFDDDTMHSCFALLCGFSEDAVEICHGGCGVGLCGCVDSECLDSWQRAHDIYIAFTAISTQEEHKLNSVGSE